MGYIPIVIQLFKFHGVKIQGTQPSKQMFPLIFPTLLQYKKVFFNTMKLTHSQRSSYNQQTINCF